VPAEVRDRAAVSDADAEVRAGQSPEKVREWDERVRRYTAESVALAQARGVPVLLLTQATRELEDTGRATLDDHGLDDLVRPLAGREVYHLSMKRILEGTDFVPLFADGAHLRPPGHERLAVAIVDKVRQEGLVTVP
jgi:lysophospholipase L1-like esterase